VLNATEPKRDLCGNHMVSAFLTKLREMEIRDPNLFREPPLGRTSPVAVREK
jgi:hypothetical protein